MTGSSTVDASQAVVRKPFSRGGGEVTLPQNAARELTDRIKATVGRVCLLLWEAHEGRAWVNLGHKTWAEYCRVEFDLSRSRSYELLDQGMVILRLEEASGVSGIPDISPYAASQLKPQLSEVIRAIRQRLPDAPDEDRMPVVSEVIRAERQRIQSEQREREDSPRLGAANTVVSAPAARARGAAGASLPVAIRTIAGMEVQPETPMEHLHLSGVTIDHIQRAIARLKELCAAWPCGDMHLGSAGG
jgi:hypothetical protein